MPRWFLPLLLFAVSGLVISVATLVYVSRNPGISPVAGTRVLQPDPVVQGLSIPDFALVDQNGAPRNQAMFDGQVTIIDFIFTHCPFACPTMAAAMIELQGALAGSGVRMASFSVDPERDTPARLQKYASDLGADPDCWVFLTGDFATVDRIVQGSLGFLLQPDPENPIQLPEGGTMSNIMHPTKLVLIGPDRSVLGMYDPNRNEDMKDLSLRARLAARELAATSPKP